MSDAMCRSGDSHYAGCACHEARWQERLAASEARCHDLERQRTEADCRFVGRYAEMSGSHCPWGSPCQRCQLEAADARVRALEGALTTIRLMCADGYYGPYAFTYAMEAKRIASEALAPPPEAEKKEGEK